MDTISLHDVVLVELLNDGLHFGGYAFNWVPEATLDGSGEFRRESAVNLNGGIIGPFGIAVGNAKAFLLGTKENAHQSAIEFGTILEDSILPDLTAVKSRGDFIESIHSELRGVARRLPGLLDEQ